MGSAEDPGGREYRGFLPPVPAGREPDLGAPQEPRQERAEHLGYAPPLEAQPTYVQPAPARGTYAPQPPPAAAQQPWSTAPGPVVPDNGAAVAGLSLSIAAGTLLVLSVGMSTIVSLVCAALGTYYSRQGRLRVDRGETPKHRGVAQAGFVIGIVSLVLSVLAIFVWTVVAIEYATDESFREDLRDELDGDERPPDGVESSILAGAAALRCLASLLR